MIEVTLLHLHGDDSTIVDAARVSMGKKAYLYSPEQNAKLIKYLVKQGHTSPFRHVIVRFHIKCPIYVERQLFKYQVGVTVNSISGRYVDFSDTYTYIHETSCWRAASSSTKQGLGSPLPPTKQVYARLIEERAVEASQKAYKELLDLGVAKEQARAVLPLNLNTEFIWTGSLSAFIHMCKERLDAHAQFETSKVVFHMLIAVMNTSKIPMTVEAYNLNSLIYDFIDRAYNNGIGLDDKS